MPSRFPWSKSSSTQPYQADPALDIPRSSSRQELAHNIRQSPLEGSYNPYTQAHQSTSSFDSSSPPPTANPQLSHPLGIQEQTIASQPYEQHLVYNAQSPSQKSQTTKRSLRSKFLGTSSKEEPESIFGRKKSIRRKEAPANPEYIFTTHQQEYAGPWPLNTQVGQPSNQPGSFEPYSPDFSTSQVESREIQTSHPLPPTPQQVEQFHNYQQIQVQGRQTPLQSYRSQLAEDSVRTPTPPTRRSFDSLPQPPSRPDSRPISRQSQDRAVGGVPQGQISQQEPYQAQTIQDSNQQYVQQAAPNSSLASPTPKQQRQNYPADPTKLNPASRENSFTPNPSPLSRLDSNPQNNQELTAGMQRGQAGAQEGEMHSRTPPPPRSASEMTEAEVNQLIRDHREMKQKYNNVKRQYFDKRDQVDALQNTLAHQRLAQSRTHWDDGEYVTRMTRLDGLIAQLAHGMRKDWKVIPEWLQPHCNRDALQVGKQEMIAVGRAFVSRWLADELFNKYFHPGLPLDMSAHLKWIQRNMRESAPQSHSGEEKEALTAKIINWRLATVDGLQPILSSAEVNSNRQSFTNLLNERLVQDIKKHMQQDPAPAGVEGGVHMVVELAVAILANLPLESRDINVDYFLPGHLIMQDLMKVEAGIPPLPDSAHPQDSSEGDQGSTNSGSGGPEGHTHDVEAESGSNQEDPSKRGFLSGLVNKRPSSPQRNYAVKQGTQVAANQNSLPQPTGAVREERVRMCVFLGVENRGKMVLVKAPVYSRA